jgi:hypothetical protein
MNDDINVTAYGRSLGKVLKQQEEIMRSQKVMVIYSSMRRRGSIKNLAMKSRLYDLVQQGRVTLQGDNPDFLQDEYLAEFIDK